MNLRMGIRCLVAVAVLLAFGMPADAASKKKDKKSKTAAQDADPLRAALEGKTPQEKIDYLTPIVEGDAPSKEAWFHFGNAKYEAGDLPGATTAFEKAVAVDSTFFKAIVNLGLMYDEQQNYDKAIETLEQAAKLDPNNPEVWSYMGNAYYAHRDYPKAMELYKKALHIQPNAPQALYSLGVAFADASMFREAVSYWKRVLDADPNGELAKNAKENIDLLQKYLIP